MPEYGRDVSSRQPRPVSRVWKFHALFFDCGLTLLLSENTESTLIYELLQH
jgi:hypothetical protein